MANARIAGLAVVVAVLTAGAGSAGAAGSAPVVTPPAEVTTR